MSSLSSMLATYRISAHTGFAPDTPCPSKFTSSRFDPWLSIAARLPELIKTNAIRKALEELPVLSTDGSSPESGTGGQNKHDKGDGLRDYDEYRLAYVLLSFFAQAYIWGNANNDQPSNTLPPSVAVPLTQVAYDLGVVPSFVYAAGSLWLVTDDPAGFNGKRCVVSFTGTPDEEHFNLTTYAVEQTGGRALHCALLASKEVGTHMQHLHNVNGPNGTSDKASANVQGKDTEKIVEALKEVAETLKKCKAILNSMRQGCDPDVFYTQLRPYLVGSLSVEGGVRYLGTEEEDVIRRFPGASAAQSSLFQSLDVLLGVQHSSGGREAFVKEMRKAMPDDHVRFIHDLSNLPSISAFVSTQTEESDVKMAYNEAIKALGEFRSEHVRIVTSYILQPSKRAAKSKSNSNGNETGEEAPKQGSGGSADLMGLLKGMRDDTAQAGLKAD